MNFDMTAARKAAENIRSPQFDAAIERIVELETVLDGVIRSLRYGNVPYAVDLERAISNTDMPNNHIAREKALGDALKLALARDGCRCDAGVCDWCKFGGWVQISPDTVKQLREALAAKEPNV